MGRECTPVFKRAKSRFLVGKSTTPKPISSPKLRTTPDTSVNSLDLSENDSLADQLPSDCDESITITSPSIPSQKAAEPIQLLKPEINTPELKHNLSEQTATSVEDFSTLDLSEFD